MDLKRPGRIDVKLPIFPTTTAREGFDLIRALMRVHGMNLDDTRFTGGFRSDVLSAGHLLGDKASCSFL